MSLVLATIRQSATRMLLTALAITLAVTAAPQVNAAPQPVAPFASLEGWWGGIGRLRFKDGKTEDVKCRATYFIEGGGNELKQTIRCASASGKIEVKGNVRHAEGKLQGEWSELMYNINGVLEGEVTPRGFRVTVKGVEGSTLSANMDIIVKDARQMVEIQFFSDTLIGLTLVLNKG
jgi:hypothetical protein